MFTRSAFRHPCVAGLRATGPPLAAGHGAPAAVQASNNR